MASALLIASSAAIVASNRAHRQAATQAITALLPQLLNGDAAIRMAAFNRLGKIASTEHVRLCSAKRMIR